MENETGTPTSTETTEETTEVESDVNTEAVETPKTYSEEEVAEFKKKAELADNYKVRAEKAEKKAKATKDDVKEPKLSLKDTLALAKAGLEDSDFDEVISYADYRKITISDALKDKTLKTILSDKAEERATAEATNIGRSGRGTTTVSPQAILSNAQKGKLPESDADIEKLVDARMDTLRKKKA